MAEDIPGFTEFPDQLKRLLSTPSKYYHSKGFISKDTNTYYSAYTAGHKSMHIFYSKKCVVTLNTSLAPKSINIDMFKCFGHQKGAGRKLLCYALTWIKQELGLSSETIVTLVADPKSSNTVNNAVEKALNEDEAERLEAAAMKSLKAYYARYGFKGKEDTMEATLQKILGTCQSGGTRRKRFRSRAASTAPHKISRV